MNPFTILGAKIFAGTSLFLLVAVAVMGFVIRHQAGTIDNQRQTIADQSARAHVQDGAIAAAGQEAARQRQAYAEARAAGQQAIAAAEPRVRIVRQTVRNGCPTPPQIMGAGL